MEVLTGSPVILLRKHEVIAAHQGRACQRKKKKKILNNKSHIWIILRLVRVFPD